MLGHEELLRLLEPKIKSVLNQTSFQNREDLEQELIVLVLENAEKVKFTQGLDFFDILNKDQ